MKKLTSTEVKILLATEHYSAFAMQWLLIRSKGQRLNYAKIARDAGFRSRSLAREILLGKKRLTTRTWRSFQEALRLPSDLNPFFEYLVSSAHSDCRASEKAFELQKKNISKLKIRVIDFYVLNEKKVSFRKASIHWPAIYAALGSHDRGGATLQEISIKTDLNPLLVESELNELQRFELVQKFGIRFRATREHLSLIGDQSEEFLKKIFVWQSQEAVKTINSPEEKANKLFLASSFSVRQRDIPVLKRKLQETILLFIDQAEAFDGDKVSRLTVSFF